jgi:hypothetical protein
MVNQSHPLAQLVLGNFNMNITILWIRNASLRVVEQP